ncbi:pleckstrin homology domain-containing protein 1 [Phtheirospermum japonicum]|uniref:Pleckstrin homology domain-containing protein 1 n=1 Tax=Phtheirospermum japonicum TaxID=374723 RepID=A0A830B5S1_9LAMI|nr:pleckstrin homology domain-containing protein 1 [Phtheirospermum japonicum]
MASLWRAAMELVQAGTNDYDGVEFWGPSERAGWLTKQGEYIKTWRRRWFVLKHRARSSDSKNRWSPAPPGHVALSRWPICLTVKGADDMLHRQFAFELSTWTETIYFIADSEKEDWINSIGRSIVKHSRSVTDDEILDYDSQK